MRNAHISRQKNLYLASIGIAALTINTIALMLLREQVHLPMLEASLISSEIGLIHTYLLHCAFMFHHQAVGVKHLTLFHGMACATMALTSMLLSAIVSMLGIAYPVTNLLAVAVASGVNYLLFLHWLWPGLPASSNQPTMIRKSLFRSWRDYAAYGGVGCMMAVALLLIHWLGNGQWQAYVILGLIFFMLFQSLSSLYLMLYTWEKPERLAASGGPTSYEPARTSFTVLLPARHEEAVIYQTIHKVWAASYPHDLLEVVVICHMDDFGTIAEARRAIAEIGSPHIWVEIFADGPINKPHGLNIGLRRTRNQVVTIFDAEDDIDAQIFNVINTVMLREQVGVVQAGVQLMNYTDHWFSCHNCLEYFFWFKSRLHFHAHHGMVPLGGNTVFIRRNLLEQVDGWDEQCLTEDADIGIRLSILGEQIRVVYDAQHVTREETPDTVEQFIKQRTRWHQGFLQVLAKGDWLRLPTLAQRLLAVYTLSYPLFQGFLLLLWPAMLLSVLWLRLPLGVTLVSFLPLYAFVMQFVVSVIGAWMFSREFKLRFPIWLPVQMALTYVPYQLMMGVSAVRAIWRETRRETGWEKTRHLGAHRRA